jgi:hypothetical protein
MMGPFLPAAGGPWRPLPPTGKSLPMWVYRLAPSVELLIRQPGAAASGPVRRG